MLTPSLPDRVLGAYLGLAIGDALGATVEFMTAPEISVTYRVHRDLTGGGWLRLKPGQITDDTQMCLALGDALVATNGEWQLRTVADAFVNWMHSRPIDIGHTCRRGLRRYQQTGTLRAPPSETDAGNGAAMRNLPVVLVSLDDLDALRQRSVEQASLTHGNALSDAATLALAEMTRRLLLGESRAAARDVADNLVARFPLFTFSPWPRRTTGYIVDTLQTVFDAFFTTTSFEECLIDVVNRGGDADTNGALAGQLAGALYGVDAIPPRWRRRLDPEITRRITQQTHQLLALSSPAPHKPQ